MMTTNDADDLVERLNAPLEHYYWEYGTAALQKEAAAEIERLRAALNSIADMDFHSDATEMADAALDNREPEYR